MQRHFIHYLPRRVARFPRKPKDPWFTKFQNPEDGFVRPMFHRSCRRFAPTRAVRPGDTIWIVSKIYSLWGSLPPGIDARIDVDRIEEREDGIIDFYAADTSSWFPLSDATNVLKKLHTIDSSGRSTKLWSSSSIPIGQSLQSMRRLRSSDELQKWCGQMGKKTIHFISYRICDGTATAFHKTKEILKNKNIVVFWDRWCLPRRLAERREVVNDIELDNYIMDQLRISHVVWGDS